jgi:hypothetical protein
MQTPDWRKILIAYIRHVYESEGWHFIPDRESRGWLPENLNEEEIDALIEARDEAKTEELS